LTFLSEEIQSINDISFSYELFGRTDKPTGLKDADAVLYIPSSFYYPYVDCILRVVDKNHVYIFGIQITTQLISKHKHSLHFFDQDDGLFKLFYDKKTQIPHNYLVWMVPKRVSEKLQREVDISDYNVDRKLKQTVVSIEL